MANFGDIPSATSLAANQAVRRNAADNGFEAFTPGSGGTGDVTGPEESNDDALASFNGATGKAIQDSGYSASSFAVSGHTHDAPVGIVPVGGIIMWSGTVASIPANWALCDGTNSTPDLRDRFVVGAKQDDSGVAKTNLTGSLTQSGGSTSYTPAGTNSGTAISDHAAHTHSVTSNVAVANHNATNTGAASAGATQRGTTASTLTLAAHTHSIGAYTHDVTNNGVTSGNPSATLTHAVSAQPTFSGTEATVVPPYYALAFIMRTA